jgi:hypothetical protein
MERYLSVESAILAQPIRQEIFMDAWKKYPVVPEREGSDARLRTLMAEEFRQRTWVCLAQLLSGVRVSLQSILNAEESILVLHDTDTILVPESDRARIVTKVARGLCYSAGASEMERDRRMRGYLLDEAMASVSGYIEREPDVVERYVEEAVFSRYGGDIIRSLGL